MPVNKNRYKEILEYLKNKNAVLVAVSKIKPASDIQKLYDLEQRDFAENYVQELIDKEDKLPKDIRWHFIGHLQTNKVKYIAPFVSLIHGVDSMKLLNEINKQGEKNGRIINVLLQVHIANEETKFGLNEAELAELLSAEELKRFKNICICGLMGMASFSQDEEQVRKEFKFLKSLFDKNAVVQHFNLHFTILSMGMSSDYKMALEEGSTMVRIGSLLFGNR